MSTTLAKSLGHGDFSSKIIGRGRKAAFSPLDQALIEAMACEVVAETKEPLSRQSLADLVRRGRATLGKKISAARSGGCCEAAIKPGNTSTGFFAGPWFARRPGRSWTCMRGCGKANAEHEGLRVVPGREDEHSSASTLS